MERTVLAVHGCVLGLADAGEAHARQALTWAERRECAALPGAARRADYRAGRLAAKRAVGRLAAIGVDLTAGGSELAALRRICACRRPGAPPLARTRAARRRWCPAPVALSLAHRDGRGVAAAGPLGVRVGVDVERLGAVAETHVRYFAGAVERARGPRDAAELWALKEAAWKALALDASAAVALRVLALEFDAAGDVEAVVARGRRVPVRATLLRPWREHVVAVVVAGAP